MLEQLRMQEVTQVILTVPEGAVIPGRNYGVGEPVMIIKNPALSNLAFLTKGVSADDANGHIGTSKITKNIDFTINDGSVLFGLWSYLHGFNDTDTDDCELRGIEYLSLDEDGLLPLSAAPKALYLYETYENENILIPGNKYEVVYDEDDKGNKKYYISYNDADKTKEYLAIYNYTVKPLSVSNIKQIHNNVFCAMDIYIDAVDLKNDEKHTVYIHCDKVQVDTDLVLSVNDSRKASFTPIQISSIPEGNELNKDIATVVVI